MRANSHKLSHTDAWTDNTARLWGQLCKAGTDQEEGEEWQTGQTTQHGCGTSSHG